MAQSWTVKDGDCLAVIAEETGLFWETIWNHPGNARLRNTGRSPTVLLPGDVVHVPDKRRREEVCSTARRHVFRVNGVPVKFSVRLLDSEGEPRAGLRYSLDVDGSVTKGTVEDDGVISKTIPAKAQKATLTVEDPIDGEEKYEFQLGFLNPVEDVKGLQSRLKNLGFYEGEPNGTVDEKTKAALAKFQAQSGVPATGETDAATSEALRQKHGC
jgi:N-acetylmuramoyl-L-alanine amidase